MTNKAKKRIALLDLGSNSCRMSIYDIQTDGTYACVKNFRDYVRLSEGLNATGKLSAMPMLRTVLSLKKFVEKAKEMQVEEMILLATEAVRRARNQQAFIEYVKESTGLCVRVLSGSEESYYDYLGSASLVGEHGVLLDVGGGSFELICVEHGKVIFDMCKPEGSVVTADSFANREDQMLPHFYQMFEESIPEVLRGGAFIGLGGTARAAYILLSGEKENKNSVHGNRMKKEDLQSLYARVKSLSLQERKALPIVGEERGDILLSGLAPLVAASNVMQADMILSCHGVREGFLREYIKENM